VVIRQADPDEAADGIELNTVAQVASRVGLAALGFGFNSTPYDLILMGFVTVFTLVFRIPLSRGGCAAHEHDRGTLEAFGADPDRNRGSSFFVLTRFLHAKPDPLRLKTLWILTRFLHANRCPPRLKTL